MSSRYDHGGYIGTTPILSHLPPQDGIWNIQATYDREMLLLSTIVYKTMSTTQTTLNNSVTYGTKTGLWNTTPIINTSDLFTSDGTTITVPVDGIYLCIVSIMVPQNSGANERVSMGIRFVINGSSSVQETGTQGYIRYPAYASSHGLETIYQLTAGDTIATEHAELSASDTTVTTSTQGYLILVRLP